MKHNYLKHLFTALLLLCTTVATAHDFEVGGIYYNITNATNKIVAVTYRGNSYSAYSNEYTGSIVIPESVTYNGNTYSVISIGERAFYGCSGLTSIVIPDSVTNIGEYAFSGTAWYNNQPNGIVYAGNVLYKYKGAMPVNTSIVIKDGTKAIANDAFSYCSGLTSVIIPNSVTNIGRYAFLGCTGLTSIIIPNSVTSIGSQAFSGCSDLKSVEFNAVNCTTMGNLNSPVFNGCTALSTVTIGENVKNIPEAAFVDCSGLKSIEISNSVTSIGYSAFWGCSGLTSVVIPNSVTSIGDYAFYDCTGLTSVVIGNGITNIDYEVFSGCTSLKNLRIEDSENQLTFKSKTPYLETLYLGREISSNLYPFCKNKNLTSLTIGGCVTKIGKQAFMGCSGLTSIVIPNSVTSIEEYAFVDCTSLTSIEIPNSITKIGYGAFLGCALKEVYISDLAAWCDIDFESSFFDYADNLYLNGELLTELVIPNEVAEIKKYAFCYCTGLTSVTIPNSVTSVGEYAFYGCSGLTSITSLIPTDAMYAVNTNTFNKVDKNVCTLYVPYGAKETYASTSGWSEFANIVELEQPSIKVSINEYGCATYCSPYALDFSNVEGLKAYAATGYKSNSQVVTLTRVQTAEAGVGLFLKGEPGEYVVPVIESTDEHSLNMLVGTLEQTVVNSTDGAMSNYKFTIADGDAAPMFYPFEDNTTFSAGKAYLQIPTAWLPATAQKSLSVRFDEGETTDIDEVKGESGEVKTIYDLQGRVVENPTSGIYIIDGKKVIIK